LTDAPFLAAKAALACAAAVGLTHWLHVPDALSAGFVAVACTSPTAYAGIRRGLEQVGGSVVGGLLAAVALLAFPSPALAPLACGLAVGLAVLACRWLRMPTGHIVAGLTVVYVVTLPHASATQAVEVRLESLAIGIAAATVMNVAVSAAFSEGVVERRVRRARVFVGESLARALEAPARADALLEPAFAVLAELCTDLDGASRELYLRSRTARARAHLAQAIRLRQMLHLAKTLLVLHAEGDARARVTDVARALRTGDAPPPGATTALAEELRVRGGSEPAPLGTAPRD
jgi:uncharacterized membrane protein YccC